MLDGVGAQPHAQCWKSLVTLFRHMDVHVCTDDIGSLQSAMQIFIGRVYMEKDKDKRDKSTVLISDYCLYRLHW